MFYIASDTYFGIWNNKEYEAPGLLQIMYAWLLKISK